MPAVTVVKTLAIMVTMTAMATMTTITINNVLTIPINILNSRYKQSHCCRLLAPTCLLTRIERSL